MFNPSSVVIEAFVDELVEHYVNMYDHNESDIHLIEWPRKCIANA